jgi:probable F420-dependent oxidoreductase
VDFWLLASFVGPRDLVPVAQKAEECGYRGLMLGDHLFFAEKTYSDYPYDKPPFDESTPWHDPWVAFAALSQVTQRLEFMSNIYIVPLRPPLAIAKQISTAAAIAGGRIQLGTGIGWEPEEYRQCGQDFKTRGRRLDETIDILRAAWTGEMVEYRGEHYEFDRLAMRPAPSEPIPILVGGDVDVALRRAATKGDGWCGAYYDLETALGHLNRLEDLRREHGTDGRGDFQKVVGIHDLPDVDVVHRLEEAGTTALTTAPWGLFEPDLSRANMIAQIESYAEGVLHKV